MIVYLGCYTDGAGYDGFVAGNYPDPVVRAKHVLATDMAGNWERIWGEKYEPRGCSALARDSNSSAVPRLKYAIVEM